MEKIRTMTPGGCVETYLEKIEKELGAGKLDEEGKRWLKMFNETVADAINLNVPLPQNIYSAYIKAVKLVKDAVKDLKDKNYVDGISKLVEGSFSSVGTIPIQPLGIIATVGKFGCRLIRNAFHSAKKRK